ncbi:hypothetical protein U0070_006541, partial [Myodes glareolus]
MLTEASEKVRTICLPEKPHDPRKRVATQKVRLWSWGRGGGGGGPDPSVSPEARQVQTDSAESNRIQIRSATLRRKRRKTFTGHRTYMLASLPPE